MKIEKLQDNYEAIQQVEKSTIIAHGTTREEAMDSCFEIYSDLKEYNEELRNNK